MRIPPCARRIGCKVFRKPRLSFVRFGACASFACRTTRSGSPVERPGRCLRAPAAGPVPPSSLSRHRSSTCHFRLSAGGSAFALPWRPVGAYYVALIALAGSMVLAWLTGDVRKYGHNLERLIDLAAKMPDGDSKDRMDAAVREEAARLVMTPPRVKRAQRIVLVPGLLLAPPLLVSWRVSRGDTPKEAVSLLWLLLVMYLLVEVLFALAEIARFYFQSWSWPQRLPHRIRPRQRYTPAPPDSASGDQLRRAAPVHGHAEQTEPE